MAFEALIRDDCLHTSVRVCNVQFDNHHRGILYSIVTVVTIVQPEAAKDSAQPILAGMEFFRNIIGIVYDRFFNKRHIGRADGIRDSFTVQIIGRVADSTDIQNCFGRIFAQYKAPRKIG